MSLPERGVVCPLPSRFPETLVESSQAAVPLSAGAVLVQTHFLVRVVVVLFHALALLCSVSCRQGALQEDQDVQVSLQEVSSILLAAPCPPPLALEPATLSWKI